MPKLDAIELETSNNPDAAVIWLHGLGANGNDFVPVVQQLHQASKLGIRFIFPHAPIRPITINQGFEMPGWYDISDQAIVGDEDTEGIKESSNAIRELCEDQQARGIIPQRTILAGFSQGGAIALDCGLSYPKALSGIMALSTYLPQCTELGTNETSSNRSTPIMMGHGIQDDVVAPHFGKASYERLIAAGYSVSWHEYPMAHSVCPEQIEDIDTWLFNCLAEPQP